MENQMRLVTVRAPVNIAVIKYWGKIDEDLIIPTNDSISGTLDVNDLHAFTTVACSPEFVADEMYLNGKQESIESNKRLVNCLAAVRTLSRAPWRDWRIKIVSRNNFPTAAGLASSAAGYACLMYGLGQLLGVTDREEISRLARVGSGSACRSVYGGFVQWHAGTDDRSSIARQISPSWPGMRVLVLVVSDQRKTTSSTSGMKTTVQTSSLFPTRVAAVVPARVEAMRTAILTRDYDTFARITMQDSNQFHCLCQDTWPPIRYTNDTSWALIKFIHAYNDCQAKLNSNSDQKYRAAYTFDAGPNCCVYTMEPEVPTLLALIQRYFPPSSANTSIEVKGMPTSATTQLDPQLVEEMDKLVPIQPDGLKYIISTQIGRGPEIIPPGSEKDLIGPDGNPIL